MGKLDDVKLTIDANIRENGNEDITGGVLNLVLTDVIEAAEVELVQLGNRVSVLEQNGGGSGGGGGGGECSSVAASIVQEIVDNECVTAAALNDLNDRIKELEERLKNAGL